MKNWKGILIIIAAAIAGACAGFGYKSCRRIVPESRHNSPILIDLLEEEKEEIDDRIDTLWIKIKENDKTYDKVVGSIVQLDDSSSYVLFIDYIDSQKPRLDSIVSSKR